MSEHSEARLRTFEFLSRYFGARLVEFLNDDEFAEEWSMSLYPEVRGETIDVPVKIKVPIAFPIRPIKIYGAESTRELIHFLPHVSTQSLNICTHDPITNIANVNAPEAVAYAYLRQAKDIIQAGLNSENFDDYHKEFINYWAESYFKSTPVEINWLSFIDEPNPSQVRVAILTPALFGRWKYIIFSTETQFTHIKSLLHVQDIKYSLETAFYLGELPELLPPFPRSNGDIAEIVKQRSLSASFDEFIAGSHHRFCFFKKTLGSKAHFFGWKQRSPIVTRNGHRNKSITATQAYSSYNKTGDITRILPQEISQHRITMREGEASQQIVNKVFFAGLGSIGSYILRFLSTLKPSAYYLVDNDTMSIENLSRHTLGLSHCGDLKVTAMKNEMLSANPLLSVEWSALDCVSLLSSSFDSIISSDVAFFVTGDHNSELWVDKAMTERKFQTPCFYVWVEPFLAAGHIIYIHPNAQRRLSDFFDGGEYRYNIIGNLEEIQYLDREPACQTTFIPYAESDIMGFLGAVFFEVRQLLLNQPVIGKRIEWIGNLPYLEKRGVKVTGNYFGAQYGNIMTEDYK